MPDGIDHQCMYCHKVYEGPDAPMQPGKTIYEAPKAGTNISHGVCPEGTACANRQRRKRAVDYYKRRMYTSK